MYKQDMVLKTQQGLMCHKKTTGQHYKGKQLNSQPMDSSVFIQFAKNLFTPSPGVYLVNFMKHWSKVLVRSRLVEFYGISTIEDYFIPYPVYTYELNIHL